jgi:hypothetical protein
VAQPQRKKWPRDAANRNSPDLKQVVFKSDDPEEIVRSLKRPAENNDRRRSSPFRSAMSMLNFYISRASRELSGRKAG